MAGSVGNAMNKYEKLAQVIIKKIMESKDKDTVELRAEEAMQCLNYLMGMSRIQKIVESDHGGAEYFQ